MCVSCRAGRLGRRRARAGGGRPWSRNDMPSRTRIPGLRPGTPAARAASGTRAEPGPATSPGPCADDAGKDIWRADAIAGGKSGRMPPKGVLSRPGPSRCSGRRPRSRRFPRAARDPRRTDGVRPGPLRRMRRSSTNRAGVRTRSRDREGPQQGVLVPHGPVERVGIGRERGRKYVGYVRGGHRIPLSTDADEDRLQTAPGYGSDNPGSIPPPGGGPDMPARGGRKSLSNNCSRRVGGLPSPLCRRRVIHLRKRGNAETAMGPSV